MAKRYNMRLVLKQRFSEFFQEKVKKEQHRHLMMKMMALEVEPNLSFEELLCDEAFLHSDFVCFSRFPLMEKVIGPQTPAESTAMLKSTAAGAESGYLWWVSCQQGLAPPLLVTLVLWCSFYFLGNSEQI